MKLQELNGAKRQGVQTETKFRLLLLKKRNVASVDQEEYNALIEDESREPQCSEETKALKESPVPLDIEMRL
jgi:hypothetical protein